MIYLDNGATSFPKPRQVTDAVMEAMTQYCANPGRSSHFLAARTAQEIYKTRTALALLLGLEDAGRIVFTKNGTEALNLALKGILRPGDHVITSSMEHNAVLRPLKQLEASGGEVTIRVGENHAASIRCLSSKSNLAGMNPTDYPEMARVAEGTTVRIPQDKLKEMISRVVFAIATEDNRQILTGCLLEVEPTEARLVALDGFRLAIQKAVMPFELPGGKENVRVVIPGRVLNEMSKVLGDTDEYCTLVFDQSRMTASFGTTTLSTVLLTGEYIDYRKILPASFRTTALADRVGVQNAIDRASLMAREGKNNLIRMSFSGDTLAISSNAELGDVLEELETELTGDPIEIAFNAKYITDVIRNITDEKLCMRFNSNVSPCVIAPQEGEDYLYLILPVRVFT